MLSLRGNAFNDYHLPSDTPEHVDWQGEDLAAHPAVHGIAEALATALDERRPFSEIGVAWARPDAVHTWRP